MAEIDKAVEDEPLVENDLSQLDETTDWKAKAEELEQKRREDGIKQRERTKALKAQLEESKKTSKKEDKKESEELDYGQKAFLKASGLKNADEMQLAKDFAKRNGITLDEVIEDEDFTAKLERRRTKESNELAAEGKGRRGESGGGRTSVEYWIAKGEHPPKELGREIAEKYVEAKRNKGKDQKQFYND